MEQNFEQNVEKENLEDAFLNYYENNKEEV